LARATTRHRPAFVAGFRALTSAFGFAAMLLAPVAARADATGDAKELFVRGRDLRSVGRCVEALPLFRHALELYPEGLGSERNIAECEEQIGHFAAARRAWSDLARTLATNQDARYAGWSEDADRAVARLASQVATITIEVGGRPSSERQGVVTLNDAQLPASAWGTPLEVDPGHYVVRYQGDVPEVQPVDLAPGEARRVELHAVVPAPVAALAPTPSPSHHAGGPLRVGGWTALGLGAASFVGVVISAAVRADALHEIDQRCPGRSDCDRGLRSVHDRGSTASTLVNVFVGVGAASGAAGVALLVLGYRGEPRSEVTVTPGGVAFAGRF
jgi:hypothetical protein